MEPEKHVAVFLDRDGVLNQAFVRDGIPHPPRSLSEFRLLDDVAESCERLKALGYLLVVVTNQPDIARGTLAQLDLDQIHAALNHAVTLDSIWVCPHDDADGCLCRKPRPGLLIEAANQHGIELTRSYVVGDRWRDVEAGRAVGCRTVFVTNPGYCEPYPVYPDVRVKSLSEAAAWIEEMSPSTSRSNT